MYRNCTKSKNMLNKITSEFRGTVDLCLLVKKWVLHHRSWAVVPLLPVIQINCCRVQDLSFAAMVIQLLWLTEGPMSLCPEINETQADEGKK